MSDGDAELRLETYLARGVELPAAALPWFVFVSSVLVGGCCFVVAANARGLGALVIAAVFVPLLGWWIAFGRRPRADGEGIRRRFGRLRRWQQLERCDQRTRRLRHTTTDKYGNRRQHTEIMTETTLRFTDGEMVLSTRWVRERALERLARYAAVTLACARLPRAVVAADPEVRATLEREVPFTEIGRLRRPLRAGVLPVLLALVAMGAWGFALFLAHHVSKLADAHEAEAAEALTAPLRPYETASIREARRDRALRGAEKARTQTKVFAALAMVPAMLAIGLLASWLSAFLRHRLASRALGERIAALRR